MPDRHTPGLDVIILCGGKGIRSYPETRDLPKPLLDVGGRPILEHVMGVYAAQGHRRFLLAAGYLGELIAERYADGWDGCDVEVIDTGAETETGERVRLAADKVEGDRFFVTYGDGVGDVDLAELLDTHERSGASATLTTVPLPSQYGTVEADESGRVTRFREKPRLDDHWINAGFFVFERAALDAWQGEILERDVLPAFAARGALGVYRHAGFWQSMDTFKDRQELSALAASGSPPWARAR